LWVVIAVALGIVIYLLLRSRGGSGRHRAPAVEYAPALETFERDDDELGSGPPAAAGLAGEASDESGAGGELRSAADELKGAAGELRGAADTLRTHDGEPDAGAGSAPDAALTPEQDEREELDQDAEIRRDEAYVETIDDEGPADDTATAETPAVIEESAPPPILDEPVVEEPDSEEPATEEPATEEPATEEPVAQEPDSEEPATEEPEAPATGVDPSEYGAGSAPPGPGGTGPRGWTVKGNADSMLFYTAEAPGFARSAADVWFESEDAASAAGFTRWDDHHR
jgi:hypothetical protein